MQYIARDFKIRSENSIYLIKQVLVRLTENEYLHIQPSQSGIISDLKTSIVKSSSYIRQSTIKLKRESIDINNLLRQYYPKFELQHLYDFYIVIVKNYVLPSVQKLQKLNEERHSLSLAEQNRYLTIIEKEASRLKNEFQQINRNYRLSLQLVISADHNSIIDDFSERRNK